MGPSPLRAAAMGPRALWMRAGLCAYCLARRPLLVLTGVSLGGPWPGRCSAPCAHLDVDGSWGAQHLQGWGLSQQWDVGWGV